VSIAAEIIATRWGGRGLPLATTGGRIHHDQVRSDLDLVEVSE
jgi:xanthine dehydrogenase accessory factor